jgi:hypothetical protein
LSIWLKTPIDVRPGERLTVAAGGAFLFPIPYGCFLLRPARETLFTVVPREDRSKAKAFIDTFVYPGGDVVGLGLDAALRALTPAIGTLAPVAALRGGLGLGLGAGQRRSAERDPRPNPTPPAPSARGLAPAATWGTDPRRPP